MQQGAARLDVPYVWPTTLELPARPPKLVYLDLLHWIHLSQAMAGHSEGDAHVEMLAACLDASHSGVAVFPISGPLYGEIGNITSHRQRCQLREVIEALSGFVVVTSRPDVSVHEIETMLDRLAGPNPNPVNRMAYLDWGVFRAFGKHGGSTIKNRETGQDVTDWARANFAGGPNAFDVMLAAGELHLNRSVIEGPAPGDDEAAMIALGYNPRSTAATTERRLQQELDFVAYLNADTGWRRGRLRDCVATREFAIEIADPVTRGLLERGATVAETFGVEAPGKSHIREAFDAMPAFDVAVTMKTMYHRDPNHRWTTNDIHDIDALGLTVPYCDVVVTDKAAAAQLNDGGVADRLDTIVLARLSDLSAHF